MWGGFRHNHRQRGEDTTHHRGGVGGEGGRTTATAVEEEVDGSSSHKGHLPFPRTPSSCSTGAGGAVIDKKGGGGATAATTASTVFSSPETTTTTTTPHGRHRPAAEHASEECNGAAGRDEGPGGSARKKLFHSPDSSEAGTIHRQSNGHANVVEGEDDDEVVILRSRLAEKVEENRRLDRRVKTLTETVFALEEEVDRCNQENQNSSQRQRDQNHDERQHHQRRDGECGDGDDEKSTPAPPPPPAEENDEDGEDLDGDGGGRSSPPGSSDPSPSPSRTAGSSRPRRRRRRDEMHRRACEALSAIVNDIIAESSSGRRRGGVGAKTTASTTKSSPEPCSEQVDVDITGMMDDFSTLLESFAAENAPVTDDEEVYDGKSTVVDRADVGWFANELRWHFDEIVRVHAVQRAARSASSESCDGGGDGREEEAVRVALGDVLERFRSDRGWLCDDYDDLGEEEDDGGEAEYGHGHADGDGDGEVPRQSEEEPSSSGDEVLLESAAAAAATAGGGNGPGDGDLVDLTIPAAVAVAATTTPSSSSPLSSPLDPRIVNAIACSSSSSSTTLHRPGFHGDDDRELMRKQIVALANALRKSETERAELLEKMVRSEREAGVGG